MEQNSSNQIPPLGPFYPLMVHVWLCPVDGTNRFHFIKAVKAVSFLKTDMKEKLENLHHAATNAYMTGPEPQPQPVTPPPMSMCHMVVCPLMARLTYWLQQAAVAQPLKLRSCSLKRLREPLAPSQL